MSVPRAVEDVCIRDVLVFELTDAAETLATCGTQPARGKPQRCWEHCAKCGVSWALVFNATHAT
jgi:hypothetical protein